jgi:uncharacterized membrane protein
MTTTPPPFAVYRGWLPAVSGRLSFSIFGRTTTPKKATPVNVADRKSRYLASFQPRDASDIVLPFRSVLGPAFAKIDGNFWCLFLARTENKWGLGQEHLAGRAFIFANSESWNKVVRPVVEEYQSLLRDFRYAEHRDLGAYVSGRDSVVVAHCTKFASFYADAQIARTGTTEVILPPILQFAEDAPKLPNDPMKLEHIAHIISAQLFFFLKDLGHRHQHHDPRTDTITDLWRVDNDNDLNWRLNTLYGMYRKVIEYKRNPNVSTFYDCLGIIAYAKTFLNICGEELPEGTKLPAYYDAETIESVTATQNRVEREIEIYEKQQDTIRNTVLAIIGATVSFAALSALSTYKPTVEPAWLVSKFIELSLTWPIVTLCIVILVVYVVVKISDLKYSDTKQKSIAVIRAVQFLPKSAVISLFALLIAILMLLFVIAFPG